MNWWQGFILMALQLSGVYFLLWDLTAHIKKSSDYMVFKPILNIQWQKTHEGLLPIPGKKILFLNTVKLIWKENFKYQ